MDPQIKALADQLLPGVKASLLQLAGDLGEHFRGGLAEMVEREAPIAAMAAAELAMGYPSAQVTINHLRGHVVMFAGSEAITAKYEVGKTLATIAESVVVTAAKLAGQFIRTAAVAAIAG